MESYEPADRFLVVAHPDGTVEELDLADAAARLARLEQAAYVAARDLRAVARSLPEGPTRRVLEALTGNLAGALRPVVVPEG